MDEPFRDEIDDRIILECSAFAFRERQFRALSQAASGIGDSSIFLSLVSVYAEEPQYVEGFTWEISPGDFDSYDRAPYEDHEVDEVFGIPLHRVLHSPQGQWGVIFDDEFAVLGGASALVNQFRERYVDWRQEQLRFAERHLEAARIRGVDVSWVPLLLRHVYGSEAPAFIP